MDLESRTLEFYRQSFRVTKADLYFELLALVKEVDQQAREDEQLKLREKEAS